MITLNKEQAEEILKYLKDAKQSEDPADYEEDGQWGPAAGFYARDAQEYNKKLKATIRNLKKLIKESELK